MPAPLTIGTSRSLLSTAGFNPRSYGSLKVWLDATLIPVVSDGTALANWPDNSGTGNNATQAGSPKPVYKVNQQNSKPGVLFTAASSQRFSLTTGLVGQNWTVFAILKHNSSQNGAMMGGGSGAFTWRIDVTTGVQNVLKASVASVGTSSTGLGTTAFKSINAGYDGTNLTFRLNGAADGGATASQTFTANLDTIGAQDAVATTPFDGVICELLIYQALLTTAQRQQIELYLNQKWAVY